MYSIRSMVSCRAISTSALRRCYDPRNRISIAYNTTVKKEVPSSAKRERPLFLPKDTFEEQMKSQRVHSADEEYGVKPTRLQKLFLLATYMYEKEADIPAYVANSTMNRMHDRMRVLTTTIGVAGFFIFFYCCHLATINLVMRDREAEFKN